MMFSRVFVNEPFKKKYFNEKYKKISKKKINYFSFSFSIKIFPKLTLLEYLLTIPFNDK